MQQINTTNIDPKALRDGHEYYYLPRDYADGKNDEALYLSVQYRTPASLRGMTRGMYFVEFNGKLWGYLTAAAMLKKAAYFIAKYNMVEAA